MWVEQANLLLGPTSTSDRWDWALCDGTVKEDNIVDIQSIDVSPDPPEAGKNLTVIVKGTAKEQIEEGAYADVSVRAGRIKLLQRTFDLCEEARGAEIDIQCPIEEGDYTVEHTVALPKEIPPAKFAIQVNAFTAEDIALVCLDLSINFMRF